jgi:hypothetical protein
MRRGKGQALTRGIGGKQMKEKPKKQSKKISSKIMAEYEARRGTSVNSRRRMKKMKEKAQKNKKTSSMMMAEYEERRGSSMNSRRRMPSVMNLMRVLSLTT